MLNDRVLDVATDDSLPDDLRRALLWRAAVNKNWPALCTMPCRRCKDHGRHSLVSFHALREGYLLCDQCLREVTGR